MRFFKRHKVFTIIISLVIVIVIAFLSTGYYFLSKISYDDGTAVTAPTLPDGETDPDDEDALNSGEIDPEDAQKLSEADKSITENLDDSKVWYSDDVMNILLMGIDYGSEKFPYGRSDAMILVSVNKKMKTIQLISLSRTAYSAIPGYKNTRLNHAHGYGGPQLAIQAIEKNYKIRIDRYASATFDSFIKIIDAFGGVNITLTAEEAKALSGVFPGAFPSAGTYKLNGTQALSYARTRYIDTDRERTGRQRKVLLSLADQAKSMSVSTALSILNTVLPLVRTNFTKAELVKQAASALSYLKWDTSQCVLPHKSSGLVLRGGFEVVIVDWKDEVAYTHDLVYKGVDVKYEDA